MNVLVSKHLNIVEILLNYGTEFTRECIMRLVELLTIEKISSLLTTCKHLFKAPEITLYYAPKLWNNNDEVRKIFVAMTETYKSRWILSWVDTSQVEKMTLGIKLGSKLFKNGTNSSLILPLLLDGVESLV